MKVILISGKARSGKDYVGEIFKKQLEERGKKAMITHYGDLVKYVATMFFNWNGEKDEAGRKLLQHMGTDIVRAKDRNFWVDFLVDIAEMFEDLWDYLIIPDLRFENEVYQFQLHDFDVTTVRVINPEPLDKLEGEAATHISEIALDNFDFDYIIINRIGTPAAEDYVKYIIDQKEKKHAD